MTFKHHKKNNFTMVYGFIGKEKFYSLVMTLQERTNVTWIYGFLSKKQLNLVDFKKLWAYLNTIITTSFLMIEVLPEHSKVYKIFLNVIHNKKAVTFNNFESEILKIKMQKNFSTKRRKNE